MAVKTGYVLSNKNTLCECAVCSSLYYLQSELFEIFKDDKYDKEIKYIKDDKDDKSVVDK